MSECAFFMRVTEASLSEGKLPDILQASNCWRMNAIKPKRKSHNWCGKDRAKVSGTSPLIVTPR